MPAPKLIQRLLSSNPRTNPAGFAILLLLLLYLALLAAPGFLFAENISSGALTIYSHTSTPGLQKDLQAATQILRRSPLNDDRLSQHFYLTGSPSEYTFWAPSAAHAFGITLPLIRNSYLAPSNPASDTIHANRASFNRRPLSAVLAHERMHLLLTHHFGLIRTSLAPTWKIEGYCDYIAGGHSIGDAAAGMKLLASSPQTAPAIAYFRDALRVRYLLEEKHLSVDQLFTQHFDTAQLDRVALTQFAPKQ